MNSIYEKVLVDVSKAYLSQDDIKGSVLIFNSSKFDIHLSIYSNNYVSPHVYVYTPRKSDLNKPYIDDITTLYLHYRIDSLHEYSTKVDVSDEYGKISWKRLIEHVRQHIYAISRLTRCLLCYTYIIPHDGMDILQRDYNHRHPFIYNPSVCNECGIKSISSMDECTRECMICCNTIEFETLETRLIVRMLCCNNKFICNECIERNRHSDCPFCRQAIRY